MAAQSTGSQTIGVEQIAKPRRGPAWTEPYKILLRKKPLATFGLVVMTVMILMTVFAEFIAPYDPVAMSLVDKLKPPSPAHILGTDQFGRDLFSRIVYGARISLYVGFGVMIVGTSFATVWGCVAGYFGGKFDSISLRIIDAVFSIPSLVLILTIVSVIGPGLMNIMLALAFRQAIGQTRTIRSAAIGIKNNMYMDAAKAIGCTDAHIIWRYVLPNVMAPVIVVGSLSLGQAILAESSLAFLGFGVPPPNPTWGGMLSDEGRRYMVQAPWMAIAPGMALSLVIFGINMLGDGLRDALDPRLKR
jgi:peptide/nickel transport system permease protein